MTSGINTEPIINDIHNFVNTATPWINSIINNTTNNSNTAPRINAEHINTQVNGFFNNMNPILNPLLQAFSNMAHSGNTTSNTGANIPRTYMNYYNPRF